MPRFKNKVLRAVTSTQPTSIDLDGFSFSLGPGSSNTHQDKFFQIGNTYSAAAFQRIFGTIPAADRLKTSLFCGAYHYTARVTNNGNHPVRIACYRAFFKDDLDQPEVGTLTAPQTFNDWIYAGWDDQNYNFGAPTYRNTDLRFNGNVNQWLKIRRVRYRLLRPGQSISVTRGSKRYRVIKYDRLNESDKLYYRRYSSMHFVQVTPIVGHSGSAAAPTFDLANNPLVCPLWRLDIEWKTHHFYKKVPQVVGTVTSGFSGPSGLIPGQPVTHVNAMDYKAETVSDVI